MAKTYREALSDAVEYIGGCPYDWHDESGVLGNDEGWRETEYGIRPKWCHGKNRCTANEIDAKECWMLFLKGVKKRPKGSWE